MTFISSCDDCYFPTFASLLLFILNEITKIYIKSKNVNNNSVICLINLRTWVLKKINIFYALFHFSHNFFLFHNKNK